MRFLIRFLIKIVLMNYVFIFSELLFVLIEELILKIGFIIFLKYDCVFRLMYRLIMCVFFWRVLKRIFLLFRFIDEFVV